LICKILHILPGEYQAFKSSWMLLSDEKQCFDELVTKLCSFERDIKTSASGNTTSTNQEVLVAKSFRSHGDVQKSKFQKKKVKGNCNYCHQPGHYVKSCSKWIADGRPAKNMTAAASNSQNSSTTNVVLSVCSCAEAMIANSHNIYTLQAAQSQTVQVNVATVIC